MLNALISGLTPTAKGILNTALIDVFGEDEVELVELNESNMRMRVRLSMRNISDMLVVLDKNAREACKDIENGLYSSDKFYAYEDDAALVGYLNDRFGLSIPVPESAVQKEETLNNQAVSNEVEKLRSMLNTKDMLIENLNSQIRELSKMVEEGVSVDEGSNLEELQFKIGNLENQVFELSSANKALSEERDSLGQRVNTLEDEKKSLVEKVGLINSELTDYKVKFSAQVSIIDANEDEVSNLKTSVEELSKYKDEIETYKANCAKLEDKVRRLEGNIAVKDADIESKQLEINEGIKDKETLKALTNEKERLEKELQEKVFECTQLKKERDNALSGGSAEVKNLKKKLAESDDALMSLNKEKIELQNKLTILEKSTSRDSDIESIMSELTNLQMQYDKLSGSVFSQLDRLSSIKSSVKVHLIRSQLMCNNIRFVFSGSSESRKGTYKCLYEEFTKLPDSEKILIVDAVTETSIDYVFKIEKVISGIEWFKRGGNLDKYLSSTCVENIKVLSPGLTYVNDGYFLTVDWESRIRELENSGYKVVLYCGDISNLIGRILHESFASLGTSMIYVHGNTVSSRTLIPNIRGISNSQDSIICYYEFNKRIKKFYELAEKTNECRVIGMSNSSKSET